MRPRVASSSFASAILAATLLACGVDRTATYPTGDRILVVVPDRLGAFDARPRIDADGSVLAWHRRFGADSSAILVWDRGREAEPRPLAIDPSLSDLDLSPSGRRVLWLDAAVDRATLFFATMGDTVLKRVAFPLEYSLVSGPRWLDEETILFGASGPYGTGAYSWSPSEGLPRPLCTRNPDIEPRWLGSRPSIAIELGLVAFEQEGEFPGERDVVVCSRVDSRPLWAIQGSHPALWRTGDGGGAGILTIDRMNRLFLRHLESGEEILVLPYVFDHDLSGDGRWIFAETELPEGRYLTLRPFWDDR